MEIANKHLLFLLFKNNISLFKNDIWLFKNDISLFKNDISSFKNDISIESINIKVLLLKYRDGETNFTSIIFFKIRMIKILSK
jgi:hypothetical protein